jgi:succinate dehydrogenase / fumarate reductase iron-sulfur subunit
MKGPRILRRDVRGQDARGQAGPIDPVVPTRGTEPDAPGSAGSRPEPSALASDQAVSESPGFRFRIWRLRRADRTGHFDEFAWPGWPEATILDALLEFRRSRDRSLVMRHSCMHASCGLCSVRINGREALACDARLADLPGSTITIEPIRGGAPLADLAVDAADFHARMEAVGLPLVRQAESLRAVPPDGVPAYTRFESCIECGLCLSACPVARADRTFIGPAALAAAARVAEEPRGRPLGPILALAAEPDSVWRCHDILECSVVCPAAVDPARLVIGLRRRLALDAVGSIFRRSSGE